MAVTDPRLGQDSPLRMVTTAEDEGERALSVIFHEVYELRDRKIVDSPDTSPMDERLDNIFWAAKALQAYISGLRAR